MRKFFYMILPFLAPTLIYLGYLYFRYRDQKDRQEGRNIPNWRLFPWTKLLVSGAFLTSITLISVEFLSSQNETGRIYVPAQHINGTLIPGYYTTETNQD